MNFEQRKTEAKALVVEFLQGFVPPRGLDDNQLAIRISQIADAFARRMPVSGNFSELVSSALSRVLDTHMSNSWPPQAAFVGAMPSGEQRQFRSQETYQVEDPIDQYSSLMEAGDTVPETAIWGSFAGALPRRKLDEYRNASVLNWMRVYKTDASRLMRAKYGHVVNEYFPQEREA